MASRRQHDLFEADLQLTRLVTLEQWRARPLHERVLDLLSGALRSQM